MGSKKLFIDQDINYPFLWGLDLAAPLILKMALNITKVSLSPADKDRLQSLRSERLLYLANHPSTIEPPIAYYIANVMGSRFNYIASRSIFNWNGGLVGELIKRIGAFSVLAGGSDRESIKKARSILSSKEGKLVIYPEGMLSGENDNLLPFMPGFSQIGFWSLEDLYKKEPNSDIKVLPTFVKYIIDGSTESILKELERSIHRLEKKLGIVPKTESNLLRRFLTVGRLLLENAEYDYYIIPELEKGYNYRIGRLRHVLLNYAASKLGIEFDQEDSIQKLRTLFTTMDAIDAGFPPPGVPKLSKKDNKIIRRDIEKAYIFISIKPDYLLSYPSPERFMEWIYRFESYVFGQSHYRPRTANVLVGQPFSLSDYYTDYKSDKKNTLLLLTERLKTDMEVLMLEGMNLSKPLFSAYDAGPDLEL